MPESYQTHTVRGLHRFVGISDDPWPFLEINGSHCRIPSRKEGNCLPTIIDVLHDAEAPFISQSIWHPLEGLSTTRPWTQMGPHILEGLTPSRHGAGQPEPQKEVFPRWVKKGTSLCPGNCPISPPLTRPVWVDDPENHLGPVQDPFFRKIMREHIWGQLLKWWVKPQQPWVFLLKLKWSFWGVKWGYHHLRKHPFEPSTFMTLGIQASIFRGVLGNVNQRLPLFEPWLSKYHPTVTGSNLWHIHHLRDRWLKAKDPTNPPKNREMLNKRVLECWKSLGIHFYVFLFYIEIEWCNYLTLYSWFCSILSHMFLMCTPKLNKSIGKVLGILRNMWIWTPSLLELYRGSLGILAHLLRMVMEPKYYAFRFGDCTPLAHPLTFGDWIPRGCVYTMVFLGRTYTCRVEV